MELKHYLTVLSMALIVSSILGCRSDAKTSREPTSPKSPPEAASKPKTTATPSNKVLTLDEGMIANIKIEELVEKPIPLVLTATGKVQFNEDQVARIMAPMNGQALQLRVKIGDTVRKGETLFFIHSREVAAAITEHIESHKDLDLAEKTYLMTKD